MFERLSGYLSRMKRADTKKKGGKNALLSRGFWRLKFNLSNLDIMDFMVYMDFAPSDITETI